MYDFRPSFRKFVKGPKLEFEILRVWGANTPLDETLTWGANTEL